MRRILGATVALLVVMPGIAVAQSPRQPVVELGAQGSRRTGDETRVSWTLRLTVPLNRGTAIEGTAQESFEREFGGGCRTSSREFGVHWRQTVIAPDGKAVNVAIRWR